MELIDEGMLRLLFFRCSFTIKVIEGMESLFLLSCQKMYARLTIDFRRDIELVKLDLLIVLRYIHELRCVDAMATQVIYYSITVMKYIQSQRFE